MSQTALFDVAPAAPKRREQDRAWEELRHQGRRAWRLRWLASYAWVQEQRDGSWDLHINGLMGIERVGRFPSDLEARAAGFKLLDARHSGGAP